MRSAPTGRGSPRRAREPGRRGRRATAVTTTARVAGSAGCAMRNVPARPAFSPSASNQRPHASALIARPPARSPGAFRAKPPSRSTSPSTLQAITRSCRPRVTAGASARKASASARWSSATRGPPPRAPGRHARRHEVRPREGERQEGQATPRRVVQDASRGGEVEGRRPEDDQRPAEPDGASGRGSLREPLSAQAAKARKNTVAHPRATGSRGAWYQRSSQPQ